VVRDAVLQEAGMREMAVETYLGMQGARVAPDILLLCGVQDSHSHLLDTVVSR
jgi:hypothetical protein